jgi:hypothetical protein
MQNTLTESADGFQAKNLPKMTVFTRRLQCNMRLERVAVKSLQARRKDFACKIQKKWA